MSFTAFRKQLKSNSLFLGFFYFVETDMNGSSHPDHENLLHTIDSRLRASLEARRGRELFWILLTDPPWGASLRGRRQSSYLRERVVSIPVSYLNKTFFMGNPLLTIIHLFSTSWRVTPTLPQRRRQPKGSVPLSPTFIGVFHQPPSWSYRNRRDAWAAGAGTLCAGVPKEQLLVSL